MTPPIDLAKERERRRPGRPLTPNGHLDNAALHLIDARAGLHSIAGGLADAFRRVNQDLVDADVSLRHLRDTLGGKAAA